MDVSDKVFGKAGDLGYRERRRKALRIAVQCGQAGGTCFCVSMGTGPAVRAGHDLALTEILTAHRHYFLVEVGSAEGAAVLAGVPLSPATPSDSASADAIVAKTAASMGRTMHSVGLRDLLVEQP